MTEMPRVILPKKQHEMLIHKIFEEPNSKNLKVNERMIFLSTDDYNSREKYLGSALEALKKYRDENTLAPNEFETYKEAIYNYLKSTRNQ